MARFRFRQSRPSIWQFNMTPLIDVTFLLLTYFMLASHYATAEKPDMSLPQPDESQAIDRRLEEKVIVNMLYESGLHRPALTFGPMPVASLAELSGRLSELAARNPRAEVVLRADRRLRYGDVRKVMEAIAAQKLSRLQVVAEMDANR